MNLLDENNSSQLGKTLIKIKKIKQNKKVFFLLYLKEYEFRYTEGVEKLE